MQMLLSPFDSETEALESAPKTHSKYTEEPRLELMDILCKVLYLCMEASHRLFPPSPGRSQDTHQGWSSPVQTPIM